jgi:hypothetical protein
MQEFYKKALNAFMLIVLADALLAIVLVDRSYLSQQLPLAQEAGDAGALRWRVGVTAKQWYPPMVQVDAKARDKLRFDLNLPAADPDPNASADLLASDG